jgi:DNA-binding NarL/FixJ family response regulator
MAARVLIVDDEPSFRRVARQLLELRGYLVVGEAGCAATAVESVGSLAPDAILMDVRLGDDNGFELARALTRQQPALAVLLVSNSDFRHLDPLIEDCGARGFALKSQLAGVDFAQFWPAPAEAGA